MQGVQRKPNLQKETPMNKPTVFGCVSASYGIQEIVVDCLIRNGFPGFDITGLPGTAVKESRERVRSALRSSGFGFPQNRVLINLSPSNIQKDGTSLDLPIALSIALCKTVQSCNGNFTGDVRIMAIGELTLEGRLIPTRETNSALEKAISSDCQLCIVPEGCNIPPANGLFKADTLAHAISICTKALGCDPFPSMENPETIQPIFEDVIGLDTQKTALAIAASAMHGTLLFGPPGVGKTMLSTRIPVFLQRIAIHDKPMSLVLPHESSTASVLKMMVEFAQIQQHGFGGGALVLDELNKYAPKTLDLIRDVVDGRAVREAGDFMVVANLNPCPCGGLGSRQAVCSCSVKRIEGYWSKIGKPFVERFDVRLPLEESAGGLVGGIVDKSLKCEAKSDSYYIEKAFESRERQASRYKYIEEVSFNGQIGRTPKALALMSKEHELFMKLNRNTPSNARTQIGTIALARSIADFNGKPLVSEEDFFMAMELRRYGLGDYYWKSLV